LIRPLFALQQLHTLDPSDVASRRLRALFLERVGAFDDAIARLESVCEAVEKDYEETETPKAMARFAMAKADLARSRLAAGMWADAAADAEVVLDLVDDDGADASSVQDGLTAEQR